jgi:hypothetical protein
MKKKKKKKKKMLRFKRRNFQALTKNPNGNVTLRKLEVGYTKLKVLKL